MSRCNYLTKKRYKKREKAFPQQFNTKRQLDAFSFDSLACCVLLFLSLAFFFSLCCCCNLASNRVKDSERGAKSKTFPPPKPVYHPINPYKSIQILPTHHPKHPLLALDAINCVLPTVIIVGWCPFIAWAPPCHLLLQREEVGVPLVLPHQAPASSLPEGESGSLRVGLTLLALAPS